MRIPDLSGLPIKNGDSKICTCRNFGGLFAGTLIHVGQRYRGLKGKYWKLFSDYIRRRDFAKFGACISCGKRVSDWREFDAGHFISAGGGRFALLFDETNVNGECQYDNAFNENHLLPIEEVLIRVMERERPMLSKSIIEALTSKASQRKSGRKQSTSKKSKK